MTEVSRIREILCLRNNYTEIVFTSNKTFMKKCTNLIMHLTSLATKQTNETQSILRDKVDDISEDDTVAETDECFKELTEHVGLKTLTKEYQENFDRLKESFRQMREEGIPFGEEKVIVLKMYIKGSTKENSKLAERIVDSTLSKALEMTIDSNDSEEITNAVEHILDQIRSIDGTRLLSHKMDCILLTIGCSSYSGTLNLLDCFESYTMKEYLVDLALSLNFHLNDRFIVFASVSSTSIVTLQENLGCQIQEEHKCYVPIKVSCATVSSLNEVYRRFNTNPEVKYSTADALSKELDNKFSIDLCVDIGNNGNLMLEEDEDGPDTFEFFYHDNTTNLATGSNIDKTVPMTEGATNTSDMFGGMLQIKSLRELKLGDVVVMPYYLFQHSVLVTSVQITNNDARKGSIKCIHYRFPGIFSKRKIVEENVSVNLKHASLYRVNYAGVDLFSTEEAICRALRRIGEKKWRFTNRSEHLCYWAKVKPSVVNESEISKRRGSSLKQPSPYTMNMIEIEVHLAEELQIGDVIYDKSDGILVDVHALEGERGRKFRIEKVAYDDYDYIIRKESYTIDLSRDVLIVKRCNLHNCAPLEERLRRALSLVGSIGKWWTIRGFIKYCIR